MRKRFLPLFMALGLIAALTGPVSAAVTGPCVDAGSTDFNTGESVFPVTRIGISADIAVGGVNHFGACRPTDNAGINASLAGIMVQGNGGFIQTGLINCRYSNNPGMNDAGLCDNTSNNKTYAFIESKGAAPWDFQYFNLGFYTPAEGALNFTIQFNSAANAWDVLIDGYLKKRIYNRSTDVDPNQPIRVTWQFETKDRGDGLGSSSIAANIGAQRTKSPNGAWSWHTVGSIDVTNSEHVTVPNGSYGMYAYTVN